MLYLNCCSLPPQPSPWALPAEKPGANTPRSLLRAIAPCAAPTAAVPRTSAALAGSAPTAATVGADKLPETSARSLLTELYSRPNSRLLDICQVTGSLDIQHCPLWHSGAGISRDPNYHTLGSPAVQLTAKRCHLVLDLEAFTGCLRRGSPHATLAFCYSLVPLSGSFYPSGTKSTTSSGSLMFFCCAKDQIELYPDVPRFPIGYIRVSDKFVRAGEVF